MFCTCFEQIECYLLPHPGETVDADENFTGAIKGVNFN
jgi:hypothetical protein